MGSTRRFSKVERERGCVGKRAFASENTARSFLRQSQRYGALKKERMTAYRCKVCGLWHIGHVGDRLGKRER